MTQTQTTAAGWDAGALTAALAPAQGLVEWALVDGVPALYAPAPGPLTAGLVFRVGFVDETLATRGITHLVEHLALFEQNLTELHHNGQTTETYTHFHVTGDADDVVRFMSGVCAALRALPVRRLETEKTILRTEAANTSYAAAQSARLWRYGAQGLGLTGYAELGLARLTEDQVQAWASTYFTRDNAVFYVTGESLPEGLTLDLPAGRRMPVPDTPTTLTQTPAYYSHRDGVVLLDSVCERSTEALFLSRYLGRALFRDLRQEGGFSYTADADYTPWSATRASLRAYADALPDHREAALGAFVDTMASLRRVPIDEAEFELVRKQALTSLDLPHPGARSLPTNVLELLWGGDIAGVGEARERYESVTPEAVRAAAEQVWSNALLQIPTRGLEWAGVAPAPAWSADAVTGTSYAYADGEDSLVIGPDGASLVTPAGASTVRFADCVILQSRPDGARTLIGADGFTVAIEPTMFRGLTPEALAAAIDPRIPEDKIVRLPARDPQDIPAPRPADRMSRLKDVLRRRR